MGEQEQERGGGGERRKGKGETIINEYSEVLVQNVFVVQSGTTYNRSLWIACEGCGNGSPGVVQGRMRL